MIENAHTAIEHAFHHERGQVLAILIGWLGDFQLAEDALQDALLAALEHWPTDGTPQRPGAWIVQVARRKALDRIRKQSGRGRLRLEPLDQRLAAAAPDWDGFDEIPDDRLKLIFTCCHPALPEDAQIALTLHTLGGLTTAEIARAFLVPLPTLAQRLVRAKRKIKAAGIPFDVPSAQHIATRLDVVLHILYLIFSEGYSAASGNLLLRIDLCEEAIRLCRILLVLVEQAGITIPPLQAAEAHGLLALFVLHHARRHARVGTHGELILLAAQDRSRWNHAQIREGTALLEITLAKRQPGPYQLQAAIAALHVEAPSAETTDWRQIAVLYGKLCELEHTPVILLNRAVAIGMMAGSSAALKLLDEIAEGGELESYHPYHVARAEMLRRNGQLEAAQQSYLLALDLCQNAIERAAILCALERR